MTPESGIRKGDVLKDRYEILKLIGKGGMSHVYLAADLRLNGKLRAVKEVSRKANDPAGRPMEHVLAEEARVLAKLSHPNIVGIVDTEVTELFVYVVMEYVEGETLASRVKREGPLPEQDVCRWMLQVCDVLTYLHAQQPPIIYRDLKPSNIMLHPDGYVKLIDFGVVREYKNNPVSRHDTVALGTRGYAPPEQYGKEQSDPQVDVYALGATMWHLLAGKPPPLEFPLRNIREENPQVGEGIAEIIIPKCTNLERSGRYKSCAEVARDLASSKDLTKASQRRNELRTRIARAAVSAISACAVAAAALHIANSANSQQQYEAHMALAAKTAQTDTEVARRHYLEAIEVLPGGIDAYEGLIATYKADGVFTNDEKKQFEEVYLPHLDYLRALERNTELSFEIGLLYWAYYDHGQQGNGFDPEKSRENRIKASAEYFKAAAADPSFVNHDRAAMYSGIAQFSVSVANAVREGSDNETLYRDYWACLQELSQYVTGEASDSMRLDSCELIVSALETYLWKFANVASVAEADVRQVIQSVKNALTDQHNLEANLEIRRTKAMEQIEDALPKLIESIYR